MSHTKFVLFYSLFVSSFVLLKVYITYAHFLRNLPMLSISLFPIIHPTLLYHIDATIICLMILHLVCMHILLFLMIVAHSFSFASAHELLFFTSSAVATSCSIMFPIYFTSIFFLIISPFICNSIFVALNC